MEGAEHTRLVHPHLGVGCQHGVVPNYLCKAGHGCCCFANLCVQLGIQGEVAGDSRTKVSEIFYHFKGVVADGVVWDDAGVLIRDVGLFETDVEAELFSCVCKAVDESLQSFLSVCSQDSNICKQHLPN